MQLKIYGDSAHVSCRLDSFHYKIWQFVPHPFLRVWMTDQILYYIYMRYKLLRKYKLSPLVS